METKTTINKTLNLKSVSYDDYQRPVNNSRVRQIVNNFNKASIQKPLVSFRDGKYYVIDGQHRIKALMLLGYEEWTCDVITGLSKKEEAIIWDNFNGNSKPATTIERAYAQLLAGDKRALFIDQIVNETGFEIDYKSTGRAGTIIAYKALQNVEKKYGKQMLQKVLRTIRDTLGTSREALSGIVIEGLADFYNEKANSEKFKESWLTKRLCEYGIKGLLQKKTLLANSLQLKGKIAITRALIEIYNFNKSYANQI